MQFFECNSPLWWCLTCSKQISDFEYEINNGTCDDCPRLTEIAPTFWKVIMAAAGRGDEHAQQTIATYMPVAKGMGP